MQIEFAEKTILCVNREGLLRVYDFSKREALVNEKLIDESS
jgi:hypothetical protein